MAMVNRGWTGRFSLAGFCVTLSIVAAGLVGQATEKVPQRMPRQAPEEDGAGSRTPGLWASWGPWSACSQPCGLGVSERTRVCQSPHPRSPWTRRAEFGPLQSVHPAPFPYQEDRGSSPSLAHPGRPSWARPTYPLHTERNAGLALSFHGGSSAHPPVPYGGSTQRSTRHQGLPAEEPPLAPSQVLGGPHPGRRRDSAPLREGGRPHGRQGFPGRGSPPRAAQGANTVPGRPHGPAPVPPRETLPLFKPLRRGNPNRPRHPSQAESSRQRGGTSLTLEPGGGPRSRVREAIKPGKYGYGKVPFALPLHKETAEGVAPRSKRHPRDGAGQLPSPPPRSPSRKPRPEATGEAPKEPPTSGLDSGAHDKPGQAQLVVGAARTHRPAEEGAEGRLGQRGGPAETLPEARSEDGSLPERSTPPPDPSGGEEAQGRVSGGSPFLGAPPQAPPLRSLSST
ncbi:hypothetical protein JRQ81_009188 [Phrynocephalus forsythii]|uniref:ADAMTS-like protein 4 n=1 Tax=Phrynocephalus forsythii TaxID=171643 RepID=A0A9Q0X9G1_9SAUR|nr:hypothetical protein JRQ81_009188 [Phrynocephalus forsythii]